VAVAAGVAGAAVGLVFWLRVRAARPVRQGAGPGA